jgi:vitamin B12 transporter
MSSNIPLRLAAWLLSGTAAWLLAGIGQASAQQAGPRQPTGQNEPPLRLEEIVITATGRPEQRSRIASTVQVIEGEALSKSRASSVTDVLSENAVGFFSEWTPAQTSINIRGGASDGQGRDFRSQVLVLVNGRRAGTANLSKLSPNDVERIEVVRGPASVIYGSQALGGVINIILKTGRTAPGLSLGLSGGSFGNIAGRAQFGGVTAQGFDYFVSGHGARADSYHSGQGGGRQDNTGFQRRGGMAAFGYEFAPGHRIDGNVRTDGTYDAGFRGSAWNTINREDRTNASFDLTYAGRLSNDMLRWTLHGYGVQDRDIFRWAAPIIRNAAGNPAPGTSRDFNSRRLDILGFRFQPILSLLPGNEILLGIDGERSVLRSDRFRLAVPGQPALGQVPPQDNNQSETVFGFYTEGSQRLFDDRLTVRAGVRHTIGRTSFDPTPNLALQRNTSRSYEATTYSAGASFRATDWLSLRAGFATGFRAPTATEIGADFTALGGGRTFGNPNLKPETSRQLEVGATVTGRGWSLDLALFENRIQDRIQTRLRPGVANTSDWVNNSADVVIRGVEAQFSMDVLRTLRPADASGWHWSVFANGGYNFFMRDYGVAPTANTNKPERIHAYQAALGTRFGQRTGGMFPWTFSLTGVYRGPMWYNTEENLLIPQGEPNREFIHRKKPFWIVNARLDVELSANVTVFASANNIFNLNQHPIFIALDQKPFIGDARLSNGGFGNSLPGRNVIVGLQARF